MTQLPHGQSGSVNTEPPLDGNRQRMGPAHAAGRPVDRPPPSTSDFGEPTITRHNNVDAPCRCCLINSKIWPSKDRFC